MKSEIVRVGKSPGYAGGYFAFRVPGFSQILFCGSSPLEVGQVQFRKELSVEDEVVDDGAFKADSLTRRASE